MCDTHDVIRIFILPNPTLTYESRTRVENILSFVPRVTRMTSYVYSFLYVHIYIYIYIYLMGDTWHTRHERQYVFDSRSWLVCYMCIYIYIYISIWWVTRDTRVTNDNMFSTLVRDSCVTCAYIHLYISIWWVTRAAQECTNRTLISHEPLICSKMCFTKTESVQ